MYLLLLASFTISAILSVFIIKRQHAIDVPNERSSHKIPTPRGGGVAFIIAFFCGIVILFAADLMPYYVLIALAGAGGIIGLVGYLDDLNSVSPWLKALAQAASLVWGLFWLGPVPSIELSDYIWQWGVFGIVLTMIGGLWLINLYNFMDGIDGLAASQAIFIFTAAAIFSLAEGSYGQAWTLGILAASVGGFLLFNWQPAKLFMGDSGSGFLGLMVVLLAIATTPPLTLWPWAILVTLFLADSTVTVARRILRGEKWYEGHRLHAYQRLAQRWHSHKAATACYMAANIIFVFPLAWLAWKDPSYGLMASAIAWGVAFSVAYFLGAGKFPEN
jgi:glycosyltransferase WbpL